MSDRYVIPDRRMKRRERENEARFLTFSCHQRLALFSNARIKDAFAMQIEEGRQAGAYRLYAWVIMPEHVHLLIRPELPAWTVARILNRLKRPFACRVITRWRTLRAPVLARITDGGRTRFWQKGGGYDRNLRGTDEFWEKVRYIHQNPVTRGLVASPEEWAWSSARWYKGDRRGVVQIDPTRLDA